MRCLWSTFVQFSPLLSNSTTFVIFHPLCPLWSYLVHYGPTWSILSTLVLSNLFRSSYCFFFFFWSTSILFNPFRPYLVHFGHFWSPLIVFGPFHINHHICHFCDCSILDIVLITMIKIQQYNVVRFKRYKLNLPTTKGHFLWYKIRTSNFILGLTYELTIYQY